ncbi:DUF3106 domain-containing protein [Variovorax boronicumulans]|uniref:DUF3106 domain-containing protein n=1 Tax=Variovorax boronicumulans TaxID=436515 RepID=UPI003397B712
MLALAAFGLTVASAQPHHADAGKASNASATAGPTAAASAAKVAAATKPLWSELTAEQQEALKPLVSHWTAMNAGQKRKWLALSRNFANMAADDRVTLHSRMIEWAALSNQQRAQARLNFAEVKRVPADERKAKWEQYQALSEEEKRRLAERAPAKPRGAAIPIRPVSSQKLVPVPAVTPPGQHTPRILLAPSPTATPAASVLASPPTDRTPAASAAPAFAPPRANAASPPVPAEAQVPAPVPAAEQLPSAP